MKNEIYLDTETTGFNDDDQVIQIGIIDHRGNILMNTLVQCSKDIPEEAFNIHGISNEMLVSAPTFTEVYPKLKAIVEESDRVNIYNSRFDKRLIKQTCDAHGLDPIQYTKEDSRYKNAIPKDNCVMNAYARMFFDGEYVKLVEACKLEGIDCSDLKAHDAVNDCLMTLRLHQSMKAHEEKVRKRKEYRQDLKARKLALVPEDTSEYPDFGQSWRPDGYKTLSQLTKRDLNRFEFAGVCCSTFGDSGYLFKPKRKAQGESK